MTLNTDTWQKRLAKAAGLQPPESGLNANTWQKAIKELQGGTFIKIASQEVNVSTTYTSDTVVATLELGSEYWTEDSIIFVHIRDKAGKRNNYFYGSDAFILNLNDANNDANNLNGFAVSSFRYSSDKYLISYSSSRYGVYAGTLKSNGDLEIKARYNSTYSHTIDGTFTIDVYKLTLPASVVLFE